jgi:hypothetical protein
MYAHLEQQPPNVHELRSELPPEIDEVIRQGMAKDPAERPATAQELLNRAALALGEAPRQTPVTPTMTLRARAASLDQVPATTPPRARSARHPRAVRVMLGCVSVIVALAGFALGVWVPSTSSALPAGPRIKANGATLRVPQGWAALRSVSPDRPIPDLFYYGRPTPVHIPVAGAAPLGAANQGVLIGRVAAFDPDLLPGPIGRYANLHQPPAAVRLNRLQAFYYTGASNDHRRSLELYLVPTSNNVVGVACYGPLGRRNSAALARCGQIASTLRLLDSHAFSLGARPAFASRLATVLGGLASKLPRLARTLLAAPTAEAQSAAARRLAAAYGLAAALLTAPRFGRMSPAEGGINVLIRDSLRRVSGAFTSLAGAAARHSPAAYQAALTNVRGAVSQLGASLDELTKLGYSLS